MSGDVTTRVDNQWAAMDHLDADTELTFCMELYALANIIIGPIIDDRLKEKLLKPWKGAHSSHSRVCLCVYVSVCLFANYRAHRLT